MLFCELAFGLPGGARYGQWGMVNGKIPAYHETKHFRIIILTFRLITYHKLFTNDIEEQPCRIKHSAS